MTDQEIRIAIAEACGWVWYRMPNPSGTDREYRLLAHPQIHEYPEQSPEWLVRADGTERVCNAEYMWREGHVPDYPNDLNAMHEAEEALKPRQWSEYWDILDVGSTAAGGGRLKHLLHIDARRRAEAFLRTLGKWRDE